MIRYLGSAAIGLAVTLGLLYGMHVLIDSGNDVYTEAREIDMFTWIALAPKEDPPRVDELPDRPTPPADPPSLVPPANAEAGEIGIRVSPPPQDPPPASGAGISPFTSDGPLVHVVRVQPIYPNSAIAKSIEGFVTVQFDVTADGAATNVVVIESSHRVFESAAKKAALKFRFKPKVVDGIPVASTGVTYRFRFEIEN